MYVNDSEATTTFLAVKTQIQLAKDEGRRFPVAAERLRKDFFSDNLLSERRAISGASDDEVVEG